jgi:hypothetical protein
MGGRETEVGVKKMTATVEKVENTLRMIMKGTIAPDKESIEHLSRTVSKSSLMFNATQIRVDMLLAECIQLLTEEISRMSRIIDDLEGRTAIVSE